MEKGTAAKTANKWDRLGEVISESYGGTAVNKPDGGAYAYVGQIYARLGSATGGDVDDAIALWLAYCDATEAKYRADLKGVASKIGAWLAENAKSRALTAQATGQSVPASFMRAGRDGRYLPGHAPGEPEYGKPNQAHAEIANHWSFGPRDGHSAGEDGLQKLRWIIEDRVSAHVVGPHFKGATAVLVDNTLTITHTAEEVDWISARLADHLAAAAELLPFEVTWA